MLTVHNLPKLLAHCTDAGLDSRKVSLFTRDA